ncbi:TetR/AcrR family transcriptional regulator [Rummeliibacillus sp. JY-2-4R]
MTNNEDRRTIRTKNKLKTALLHLLKEKDLKELSIKEVTQYAKCNRVTFYSHYQDLQELLSSIFDDYLRDLIDYFRKSYQNLERFTSLDEQRHLPLFEFIYENQFVFSLMVKGEVIPGSQNKFCESLVQVSNAELLLGDKTEIEIPALNYFTTYGNLGFFIYWIKQDCKDSPEVMARKLSYLQSKLFTEAIVKKD